MFCFPQQEVDDGVMDLPYNDDLEEDGLRDEVTIVTAFFNIGSFAKMSGTRPASSFLEWMKKFRRITNPVIAYIDNSNDLQHFLVQRQYVAQNLTKAFLVDRKELWAFRLLPRINDVLKTLPKAPHGFPHVRNPLYAAIMHSKYELMERAIQANYFKTKYFSWVDIGFFRSMLSNTGDPIKMVLPPGLDPQKVAYSEVVPFDGTLTARQVFVKHPFWLSGNYFSATVNTMLKWAREYKRCTRRFLSRDMTGTDQMVLHAMFLPTGCNLTHSERLTLYHPSLGLGDRWHAAGRLAWYEWKRQKRLQDALDTCRHTDEVNLKIDDCMMFLEKKYFNENKHLLQTNFKTMTMV